MYLKHIPQDEFKAVKQNRSVMQKGSTERTGFFFGLIRKHLVEYYA